MAVGVPVDGRDAVPPKPSKEEQAANGELAKELAPKYRTELLM